MGRGHVHKRLMALLLVVQPWHAFAADAPQANAPAASGPRFISLDKARAQQGGVHVVRPIALHSDRMMTGGAFHSDSAPKPLPQVRSPLIVPVAKEAKEADAVKTSDDTEAPKTETGVVVQRGGIAANQEAAAKEASGEGTGTKSKGEPLFGLYDDDEEPLMSFADAMAGKRGPVSLAALGAKQAWPLPANVKQKFTSGFGVRADPFTGKQAFHGGIDLAADIGTPVLATAPGKVVEVENDPRYGNFITIEHSNGAQSRYGHLLGPAVRVGQVVAAGEMIGAVGATGRATGPHLDFRYRVNGQNVDPMRILTPPNPSLAVAQK